MGVMDNVTFLNSIAKSMSAEYNERIPQATRENLADISELINQYPTTKNEFINTLTNVVGKTIIDKRVYQNRYKFLHKGKLPYGTSIEMIVADIVKSKEFGQNFGGADTEVGSLIGKEESNVKVQYIERNVRKKYKVTISDVQLMGAFRNPNGLSELVQALVQSVLNAMEYDEELIIKKALSSVDCAKAQITGYSALTDDEQAKKLTKVIKTYVNKMGFMSANYNKLGIHTFSKPEDLVIFVTPETQANIDVELLASAFHMDKAEVSERLVLVDEFVTDNEGTLATDANCIAIIMDQNVIQLYENNNTTGTFNNPDGLFTNFFYHKWLTVGLAQQFNCLKIENK